MEENKTTTWAGDVLVQIIKDAYLLLSAENRLKNLLLASKQKDGGKLLTDLLNLENEIQGRK